MLSNKLEIKSITPNTAQFMDALTIVIVIYKHELKDSESFRSLKQMTKEGLSLDLFVYDNSPYSQKLETHEGINITYQHDAKNSGISKAYNAGVAHAQKHARKWILLLDQDTTLPKDILSKYEKAVTENPEIKLFAPILILKNGKIFSPCVYRYKRGFHPKQMNEGIHSLDQFAPVNSGMLVNVEAFEKAGGYNERVKLDFSDFQFIERFRKRHTKFYVIDSRCKQDFSDDEVSLSGQATRFVFFCQGARNIEKSGLWDHVQYTVLVLIRTLRLTLRYKSFNFLRIFSRVFLGGQNTKQ